MNKRDDILNTSMMLFNQHGYQAVGVDLIRDVAKVSKMTLYRYFATKEELVEEVLKRRHQMFRAALESAVNRHADPEDQLREIFNWHQQWFRSLQFHGCMFIKAIGEFGQTEEYLAVARQHKAWLRQFIESILVKMGIPSAATKACFIQSTLDGLIINASLFGPEEHLECTWQAACCYLGIDWSELALPQASTVPGDMLAG